MARALSPKDAGGGGPLIKKQTTIGSDAESVLKVPRYTGESIIIPDGTRRNSPRKSAKNFSSGTIADWSESG
jgi:hypothetical protein